MDEQVSQQSSLEEQLERLEGELRNGKTSAEDFRETLNSFDKARWKLQQLLEWATDQKKDDRELNRLYGRLAGVNASNLIDRLRSLGYVLVHASAKDNEEEKKRKESLKKAFDNVGYRLLEQTRAGKRQDVFYGLLRIFISLNREVPPMLVEAFKPIYSDELFKVFLFSFLSGVLGKEEE